MNLEITKKYRRLLINSSLIFLILFLSNCGMDEGSKFTGIVAKKFSNKMTRYGLHPIGLGEGINHNTKKQNYFKVVFTIESLPNIEIARCLIVNALQTLQKEINSDERIKKYLDAYPYPIKFIEVGIINKNKDERLFSVFNFKDTIIYDRRDPDPNIGMPLEYLRETFEEALQKVNCSR